MVENVIQKINLLMSMAGSNNTSEALQDEAEEITKEIIRLEKQLEQLKASMVNTKYMKASERIIDENIKIGLENKIAKFQDQLSLCVEEIANVAKEEEEYHAVVESLETDLNSLQRFIDSLNLKAKTIGSKDKSSYSLYQTLIENATNEITGVEKELKEKKAAYEQVKKRLESYGERRADLENKIKAEQAKLAETNVFLANPENYMDYKEKQEDEAKVEQLSKEIEKLERRKLEIITDPVYIGSDAIELVKNEDKNGALEKIKELVTIVETKPYMNYKYNDLVELLEEAKVKRDEFASQIEGKEYLARDNNVAYQRLEYLNKKLEKLTKTKETMEAEIKQIDTQEVKDLMAVVTELHHFKEKLHKDIEAYKEVIDENEDYKTPRKQASLKSAFKQKCEELAFIDDLWKKYEKEMENTISKSKELEEKELSKLLEEIRNIEAERKTLQNIINEENNPIDILAMEKDRAELKQLSDEVEKIVNRQKYKKMPSEIYDEIELVLKSADENKPKLRQEKTDYVNIEDYRIESINDTVFKEEEPPVVELKATELPVIEEPEKTEEELVFPPRNPINEPAKENNSKRLKVVKIEPIEEEKNVEELSEDSYMVNELEDTNYISFNDLLEDTDNGN